MFSSVQYRSGHRSTKTSRTKSVVGGTPHLKDSVVGGTPHLKDSVVGGTPHLKDSVVGGSLHLRDIIIIQRCLCSGGREYEEVLDVAVLKYNTECDVSGTKTLQQPVQCR